MIEEKKKDLVIEIGIIISQRYNTPCIELRKVSSNSELIKKIISAAWHGQIIKFVPVFHDKLKSMSSLIDKGIIYYNKEEERYFFNEF
jgi:hypothetical protein